MIMKYNEKQLTNKIKEIIKYDIYTVKLKHYAEGLAVAIIPLSLINNSLFTPIIAYLHFDNNLTLDSYKLMNDNDFNFDSLIGSTFDVECDFGFILSSNDKDISGYVKDNKYYDIKHFFNKPILPDNFDSEIITYLIDKYKDNIIKTYTTTYFDWCLVYVFDINGVNVNYSMILTDKNKDFICSVDNVNVKTIEHLKKLINKEYNLKDKMVKTIKNFDYSREHTFDEENKTVAIKYKGYNGDPKTTYTYFFDEEKMEVCCIDNKYNNKKKVPFEEKLYTERMKSIWLTGNELKIHQIDIKIKEINKQLKIEEESKAYHKERYDSDVETCNELQLKINKLQIEKDKLTNNK